MPPDPRYIGELTVGRTTHRYCSIERAASLYGHDFDRLPVSMRILLENQLRRLSGAALGDALDAFAEWLADGTSNKPIAMMPSRVLMQDISGFTALLDLAALRDRVMRDGGDPGTVQPVIPAHLVVDHSVAVDHHGSRDALARNTALEFRRHAERYGFFRWAQQAFEGLTIIPPGRGICHQINLEHLAEVVCGGPGEGSLLFPDTLVGTDSHTTMVNALGVLGWGVGGIEAAAALLGWPCEMTMPAATGCHLIGRPQPGVTGTDIVLTVTETLRRHGVVGHFVEFFGDGLDSLTLPDRATIANMAPEYGATCGFFPVDEEALRYLSLTGRDDRHIRRVEAYAKAQGLWRYGPHKPVRFTDQVELDLSGIEPVVAGPRRPQDRLPLHRVGPSFDALFPPRSATRTSAIRNGDVVIAAITSCTNTANPALMIGAGLVARNARRRGLTCKPWVKTSLAPGSRVVGDFLAASGLQADLDALGFQIVGFGCTTCVGNSGSLDEPAEQAVTADGVVAAAVLSGNRTFDARIHALVKANYLASPPLVVAYALAGTVRIDFDREPVGHDRDGSAVFLRDLWPSPETLRETVRAAVRRDHYLARGLDLTAGSVEWLRIPAPSGPSYAWDPASTVILCPPFLDDAQQAPPPGDIIGARVLAVLGDGITTDHILPVGAIPPNSTAGRYLQDLGVGTAELDSYASRRGNHEVMVRATFANLRLHNELLGDTVGSVTRHADDRRALSIYDAAMAYRRRGEPTVIVAGKEYGTGSARDWAAKGTRLLGVRAVIAESFERIHRANLAAMGVLPLQFEPGSTRHALALDGTERLDVVGIGNGLAPRCRLDLRVHRRDGTLAEFAVRCRLDTRDELLFFENGGILPTVHDRIRQHRTTA
jgi:aconitate hydratase